MSNYPDDWGDYYRTCPEHGTYHASEGGCGHCYDEIESNIEQASPIVKRALGLGFTLKQAIDIADQIIWRAMEYGSLKLVPVNRLGESVCRFLAKDKSFPWRTYYPTDEEVVKSARADYGSLEDALASEVCNRSKTIIRRHMANVEDGWN